MSTKHTPGPWEAVHSGSWRDTWIVRRENRALPAGSEVMKSPGGRATRFRSRAAADAAIAKATGEAS